MSVSRIEAAQLAPHRGSPPPPAVRGVTVSVAPAADGALRLVYRVEAPPAALQWPGADAGRGRGAPRRDGLWQHTCCELFVRCDDQGTAYREFNFSPCGAWAAYDFLDYRAPGPLPELSAPFITSGVDEDGGVVQVLLPVGWLPSGGADRGWRLGLTAVLEASDGALSFWALHHPGPRPDFHHRDGFVLHVNDRFDSFLEMP